MVHKGDPFFDSGGARCREFQWFTRHRIFKVHHNAEYQWYKKQASFVSTCIVFTNSSGLDPVASMYRDSLPECMFYICNPLHVWPSLSELFPELSGFMPGSIPAQLGSFSFRLSDSVLVKWDFYLLDIGQVMYSKVDKAGVIRTTAVKAAWAGKP